MNELDQKTRFYSAIMHVTKASSVGYGNQLDAELFAKKRVGRGHGVFSDPRSFNNRCVLV